MRVLHVTNGDSAVEVLSKAGIGPANLDAEALCEVRARFLESCGWEVADSIASGMRKRDAALPGATAGTLWFEHDLYAQLQLIRVLAMLDGRHTLLAQADTCIGSMSVAEVKRLEGKRGSPEQCAVAGRAWTAFRSAGPDAIPELLRTDISSLPYLQSALARPLEERPATANGLSRTERQILQIVSTGPASFADVFRRTRAMKEAGLAGDDVLLLSEKCLTDCRVPLLTIDPRRLTPPGGKVLKGAASHMRLNRVDRWLGGMHLLS